MVIDRIIVSSNDNEEYLEFSNIIGKAWKKILPNAKVTLLCVTSKPEIEFSNIISHYDDVIFLQNTLNIPSGNHAMASRMLIAATKYADETIMLSDIDMLPLNYSFFNNILTVIPDDKFVLLGGNAYNSNIKFPICYMIAKGTTFSKILNPENLDYYSLLYKITQCSSGQDSKNILKPYPVGTNIGRFDDEDLFSDFFVKWDERQARTIIINRNWVNSVASERIDRINWNININELQNGKIIDAHLPRPLSKNIDKIKPLLDYLTIEL